jgi:DNA-binding response OmpR family regulator
MTILFLTADLMFSSRVAGAAARLGMSLKTAATPAALMELFAAEPISLVVIDLSSPRLDLPGLIGELKTSANTPRAIIAYGPHVHENRLAEAAAAGCDEVLSRGQFSARMEETLAKWRG